MARSWAIIERELRRFSKSPMLILMSMVFPLLQLVVLGYAFGGNVKHLVLAVVDQDHGVKAVRVRELAGAVSSGAKTVDLVSYADSGDALNDLRSGRVNGVLTIPSDFSRRVLARNNPRVALISDNTDSFVSASLAATVSGIVQEANAEVVSQRVVGAFLKIVLRHQSSTKASSRLFLTAGSSTMISINKPAASKPADNGRVTNTLQSPRDSSSARRRFSSIIGPRMKPSSRGAGSQPSFTNV